MRTPTITIGSVDAVRNRISGQITFPTLDTVSLRAGDQFPPQRFHERQDLWNAYYNMHWGDWSDVTNETIRVSPRYLEQYNTDVTARMFQDKPFIEGLEEDDEVNEWLHVALYNLATNANRYGVAVAVGINEGEGTPALVSYDPRLWYPAIDGDLIVNIIEDQDNNTPIQLDVMVLPVDSEPYRTKFVYNGSQISSEMGEADLPDMTLVPIYRPPEDLNDLSGTSMYDSIWDMALECARRYTGNSEAADIGTKPLWVEDVDKTQLLQEAKQWADVTDEQFKDMSFREQLDLEANYRRAALERSVIGADRAVRGLQVQSWTSDTTASQQQIEALEAKMDNRIGIPFISSTMDRSPSGAALDAMVAPQEQRVLELRERIRLAAEQALQTAYDGAVLTWGDPEASDTTPAVSEPSAPLESDGANDQPAQ